MKIRLWSDLHLEFRTNYLGESLYDHIWEPEVSDKEETLLLAGDICVGMRARFFITELCKHFKQVLMIPGNHEFYQQDFNNLISEWRTFAGCEDNIMVEKGPDNFYFLYNDTIVLDDVRFIGGSMWTDFNDGDPFAIGAAHRIMNDYKEIRHNGANITPQFIINEHDKFKNFLLQEFDKPFDGKTVVMTHHSPGNEVRRNGRKRNNIGPAYFADIEQLIGWHNKAHLWVHGHTHQNYDYLINETRVVCNPYGYWGESTNRGFNRKLIIDV